jgi:hypothetical protein
VQEAVLLQVGMFHNYQVCVYLCVHVRVCARVRVRLDMFICVLGLGAQFAALTLLCLNVSFCTLALVTHKVDGARIGKV